jgi:hypothetical protein
LGAAITSLEFDGDLVVLVICGSWGLRAATHCFLAIYMPVCLLTVGGYLSYTQPFVRNVVTDLGSLRLGNSKRAHHWPAYCLTWRRDDLKGFKGLEVD